MSNGDSGDRPNILTAFTGLFFRDPTEPGVGIHNVFRTRKFILTLVGMVVVFWEAVFSGVILSFARAVSTPFVVLTGLAIDVIGELTGVVIGPLQLSFAVAGRTVDASGVFAFLVGVLIVAGTVFVASLLIDAFREGF